MKKRSKDKRILVERRTKKDRNKMELEVKNELVYGIERVIEGLNCGSEMEFLLRGLYEARNDEVVGSKVVHVWEVDGKDMEYKVVFVNVVRRKAVVKVELNYTVLGKEPHFYVLSLHGFIADIKLGNLLSFFMALLYIYFC